MPYWVKVRPSVCLASLWLWFLRLRLWRPLCTPLLESQVSSLKGNLNSILLCVSKWNPMGCVSSDLISVMFHWAKPNYLVDADYVVWPYVWVPRERKHKNLFPKAAHAISTVSRSLLQFSPLPPADIWEIGVALSWESVPCTVQEWFTPNCSLQHLCHVFLVVAPTLSFVTYPLCYPT